MANALNSAENKLFADLTKSELATKFVALSTEIEKLKKALKLAEAEANQIEAILLPQIGLKYQPKGAEFILMPKVAKGRKSTSYASIVEETPKACNLKAEQIAKLNDLLANYTKIGEEKVSIQIIK